MVSKNVVVVLCCLSFIVGFAAPVAFEMGADKPSYYLRPLEMAVAESKCLVSGGLSGVGVKASYNKVNFFAICDDGKEIVWEK